MGKQLWSMRVLALLTTAILMTGCSTTAFIYKKDGMVIEGKIKRSDASTIFVVPAEPSDESFVDPSRIPERAKAILIRELFEECISERTVECRKDCRTSYPSTHTKADARRCLSSCLDQDTAKSFCEPLSVLVPIARSDIDDIDHPGSSLSWIGLSMTTAGLAGYVAYRLILKGCGEFGCSKQESTGIKTMGLVVLAGIINIPVWIWGIVVWSSSRSAAVPPKNTNAPKISPVSMTDGEKTYYGLGLSWSW
jgi:hypothetical protein